MSQIHGNLGRDLVALAQFEAVAAEGSFTRAAARLGVSQSALSHGIRALEERLGVRLLSRSTRSVAATEAGARLLLTLEPALRDISLGVRTLQTPAGGPVGTVRITIASPAHDFVLRPFLKGFFGDHPGIALDISISESMVDIVAGRFDCGVRAGHIVDKDMVGVPLGPEQPMAMLAAPDYLARHGLPRRIEDIVRHNCINYRMHGTGGLFRWPVVVNGHLKEIAVSGDLTLDNADAIKSAALDGLGIAYLFRNSVEDEIASGRLVGLFHDLTPAFPRFWLYYAGRRQPPPALAAFVTALKMFHLGRPPGLPNISET